MTKKSTYLILLALTIILGTFLYYKFCCCCCNPNKDVEKTSMVKQEIVNQSFMIEDSTFKYNCEDNFNFINNKSDVILPISDSLSMGIENIKNYLNTNKNKKIKISGYAKESEKNESMYPNLGYARAISLKNLFITKGFDASRFEIDGIVKKDLIMKGDTLIGANLFKIFNTKNSTTTKQEDWGALKTSLNANPLVLCFETGQTNVNLTTEEREKVTAITKYLDNVSGSSLQVEGHTDNVGSRTINVNLGLKRANFIKEYLVKNGIDASRITTTSKGPDQPVSSNETLAGKAKNRRSIITIN
jgi:OOP family OmpA-OmpF porin